MTQTTQREKIYQFINTRKQATAQEIANWFRIPVTTARFHIRILVDAGRIQVVSSNRVRTLGKPRLVYEVVSRGEQQIFLELFDALLQNEELMAGKSETIIALLARQIGGLNNARSANLTLNLIDLIDHLNELDYAARWEVHRSAPRVILEKCPYSASACVSSHFCEMDTQIIQNWTGRVARLVRAGGINQKRESCVFEIEA